MWSVDDTGSANYHVAYGTSKSPLGPITVAKSPIVIQQDPAHAIYGTAHNSVINVPGTDEWYIVYHRINKYFIKADEQPGVHREVCIDRMEFNADGTIKPVTPTNAVTNKDGSIDLITDGNPLFRHVHTADAAAYVEGDTLWLFAGHDEDDAPNNEYKMKDWLTFSTTDLKHWHQHPVGLDISAFKWADSKQAFAGHVAKRNGKYYWYVSTNWCGIGVAVSDNIMGPWRPMGLIDGVSGNSNTTHPSIVKFKDQWLYFTHDGSLHDGHSYKRSVVMKKLEYNADGTIKPIDSTPSIVRK